ncbi:MAG: hypothetical protein ABJA02_03080 [Acidobacteriota bacterium]
MKRINNLMMIAAFSLVVLGLPAIASAQYGNGGYYPNGNNGGYGNNGYNGDIRGTLRDLRDRAKNLEQNMDRNGGGYGNRGGYGNYGNYSYNDTKRLLHEFADAAKDLDNDFDGGRNRKGYDQAQRVVNAGSQIDQMLGNGGYGRNGEWNAISNDIRIVANNFGLNYQNNRGNRNNRNNQGYPNSYPNNYPNNRNNRGNLPSWWPF